MRLNELKINGFGKLENKEIQFNKNINIIYGKNEAGKSTLLKFITGMFYGLSRNKNGQIIPDIEKFKPWKAEEFSGKIKYELDNEESYEVYRDFKKKNPKIFNNNMEDISKKFNIDKIKGNNFFYEQTGLEEDIFLSSVITKQGEVKLDEKSQNNIIQKISNILGTGEDNTSYVKIVSKLKKKINDEIGTNNTKEKPINLIEKRIDQIENEIPQLEKYQEEKFEIEETIKNKKKEITNQKEKLEILKKANILVDKAKSKETAINVAKKLVEDTKQKILNYEETYKKENKINDTKVSKTNKIIIFLLIVISILSFIFIEKIIKIIPIIITFIYIIVLLILSNKKKNVIKLKRKEYKENLKELENKQKTQENELDKLEKDYNNEIINICKNYNIKDINTIAEEMNEIQSNINELTLNLHTIEIDNNNIRSKLEKYICLIEEVKNLEEDREELQQKREEIQKAIEFLEIAYNKMKEEITPKFTEKLSNTIDKISSGKYKNVRINTLGEIIVEDKNGEYINSENLSIGTIDQLYLSLRLATIEEITKEKMPIILDEAFAYYDNERLENILKYISKEYKDNQVIIFTCTKREIEILNKENINYKLIEI